MTPSSNAGDELAPFEWLIDDLVGTILDASPDELPRLHAKLQALASAVEERFQAYTAQQVREALEKVRAEILSLTTGGPRGVEASADIVTKAIANQGVLPNSNEGGE
jgi:hypothetical protein